MQELSYENLLTDLYAKLPRKKAGAERFEVPIADVLIVGVKTTIKNFDAICAYIRRPPADVSKYLSKELAVPGVIEGTRLVLAGKFSPRAINERIASYVRERVICKECGKPDTNLMLLERNVYTLKCEACGARSSVRA